MAIVTRGDNRLHNWPELPAQFVRLPAQRILSVESHPSVGQGRDCISVGLRRLNFWRVALAI